MKKVLIICLLSLLIVGSLCADWQRIIGSSDAPIPPDKNVMKSDTSGLFIRTMVFGFTEEDTTIDEKDFKQIEIPEEYIDTDTIR
ncbi:hypothetical protein KAX75_03695, partial [candidate division WOR-3 bacterium]|nr:hypothetical protein [candidate division WOR-3 bacterium]